jgi:hypothetical protein
MRPFYKKYAALKCCFCYDSAMNLQPENIANTPANRGFTDPAVLAMMAHFQQQLAEQKALLAQRQNVIQAHELS